ncbi:hypothetical protein MalM25_34690 [Planctomycetes bacterium MalM25]|nr:hypothetical protein MalM25_34690 [Planctomycetes bacterium MalM25]
MRRFFQATGATLAALAILGTTSERAAAQFVSVNNYQAAPQATAQQPSPAPQPVYQVASRPAYGATAYQPAATAYPPVQPAPAAVYSHQTPTYTAAQPTPAYAAPTAPTAPVAAYPRVAQAAELPTPSEVVTAPAATTPTPTYSATPSEATPTSGAMPYDGGYQQQGATSYATPTASYGATNHGAVSYGSAGCATGDCNTTSGYAGYDHACATPACDAAPACNLAPCRPRRQWFAGIYGLYLNRAGDASKRAVSYMTDTTGWTAGNDYYYSSGDPILFTADASNDDFFGGEIRFGSTFGCDPCACGQPFAWEVGYWGIDDGEDVATLILPGTVGPTYFERIYTLNNYNGLYTDLDGGGATWANRPIYDDNGDPADGDLSANDVRILGMRARQSFSVQNLELNFWRFGTPTAASPCGIGGGGIASACGVGGGACGGGSCGVDACGCGPAACAPCRPPRRFFVNGLVGLRYMRVDDDFGLDWQFTTVDGTGNPPSGWPTAYESFPADDNSVIFSDYDATNDLVGFQLGCSMNWLVGCNWNFFCDSNFGIYGNDAQVNKRVYGGGASVVTFQDGSPASVVGDDTTVAYVGELRVGVGYQVTCNCRLTAAYRFIGIGGLALGAEEYQSTEWSNAVLASHIDANNSIILHGLQAGVEYKY